MNAHAINRDQLVYAIQTIKAKKWSSLLQRHTLQAYAKRLAELDSTSVSCRSIEIRSDEGTIKK